MSKDNNFSDGLVNRFSVATRQGDELEDADLARGYEATMSISENGIVLGSRTILLPAGSNRAQDPAEITPTTTDVIEISKSRSHGVPKVIVEYRVFNVSGSAADQYDVTALLRMDGVKVAEGRGTAKLV